LGQQAEEKVFEIKKCASMMVVSNKVIPGLKCHPWKKNLHFVGT